MKSPKSKPNQIKYEELKTELQKKSILLEHADTAIVSTNMKAEITGWNQQATNLFGWKEEEVLGKYISDVVAPTAERDRSWGIMDQLKKAGRWKGDLKHQHKNGSVFFTATAISLVTNGKNEPVGIVGSMRDISQEKAVTQALKQREKEYRMTFDNAPLAIMRTSLKGEILQANKSAFEMFGYSKNEFLGKNFRQITLADDLGASNHIWKQLVSGELETVQLEKRYVHKNGQVIWANLSVRLVKDLDDKPDYFISIVEDISELKKTQEELKRHRQQLENYSKHLEIAVNERTEKLADLVKAQREFIANINHELRTPLAVMRALAEKEMYLESAWSHHKKNYRLINRKVDQISQFLQNLLVLSRLELQSNPITISEVNMSDYVNKLIAEWEITNTMETPLENLIHLDIDPDLVVGIDTSKLTLILRNLLSNALKHANEDPFAKVTAQVERKNLIIRIADNNETIPAKYKEKIFDRFFRIKGSTKKTHGSGLGLYICKKLLDLQDGEIWTEPRNPKGNFFIIQLPINV